MHTRRWVAVAALMTLAGAACADGDDVATTPTTWAAPSQEMHGVQVDLPVAELARRSELVVVGTVEASPQRSRVADIPNASEAARINAGSYDWVQVRVEQTVRGATAGPTVRVGAFVPSDEGEITYDEEGGDSHEQGVKPLTKGKRVVLFLSQGTDVMAGVWILSGGNQSVWLVDGETARRLQPKQAGGPLTMPTADLLDAVASA